MATPSSPPPPSSIRAMLPNSVIFLRSKYSWKNMQLPFTALNLFSNSRAQFRLWFHIVITLFYSTNALFASPAAALLFLSCRFHSCPVLMQGCVARQLCKRFLGPHNVNEILGTSLAPISKYPSPPGFFSSLLSSFQARC